MDKDDLVFFSNVIDEFARSEWSPHQLEMAAILARAMADLEREQRLMREEGSVVENGPEKTKINPRKTVIQMYSSSIVALRRSLALHARAKEGDPRDVAKRREMTKAIEGNNPLDDELLARPN